MKNRMIKSLFFCSALVFFLVGCGGSVAEKPAKKQMRTLSFSYNSALEVEEQADLFTLYFAKTSFVTVQESAEAYEDALDDKAASMLLADLEDNYNSGDWQDCKTQPVGHADVADRYTYTMHLETTLRQTGETFSGDVYLLEVYGHVVVITYLSEDKLYEKNRPQVEALLASIQIEADELSR